MVRTVILFHCWERNFLIKNRVNGTLGELMGRWAHLDDTNSLDELRGRFLTRPVIPVLSHH